MHLIYYAHLSQTQTISAWSEQARMLRDIAVQLDIYRVASRWAMG